MYGYEPVPGSQYPLATHTTIDRCARLGPDNTLWIFLWTVRGNAVNVVIAQTKEYLRAQPLPPFQPFAYVSSI
jgi:hypothetical protein